MIKTDNGIFYMTAGEACYIARYALRTLDGVWFGARIEPEDDIYSPENSAEPEAELVLDGKTAELRVKSYDIVDKPETPDFPSMRGGETLIVKMSDSSGTVETELHYTPYPRGGIARRAVVRNLSDKPISVKVKLCVPAVGTERRERNFIEISGDGTTGVAAVYGGKYEFDFSDGLLKCSIAESTVIEPQATFVSPEILCVFADGDSGMITRIFHDIVREHIIEKKYFGARRPLPLVCSDINSADDGVTAAKQLGADSFVTDCGKSVRATSLKAVAEKCKTDGIKFGAVFDVSAYTDFDKAAAEVKSAIESVGAEIISLRGFDGYGDYEYWVKAYRFVREISHAATHPIIEGNHDLGSLCYCASCVYGDDIAYIPLCAQSKLVTGALASPKTEFDLASFGCLGYALPIKKLNDGIKRAVRAQVFSYQDDADLIMSGDLYAHECGAGEMKIVVSKDKSSAYAVFKRGAKRAGRVKLFGLDAHNLYHVRELDKTFSGAALRYVGIPLPSELDEGETLSLHLVQVVDYE